MSQHYDLAPKYFKYIKEYDISSGDLKFKKTTSKEAIQAYLIEGIYFKNNSEFMKDKEKVSELMISEFKKTDCYKEKSKKERQEIINYLKENTTFEEPKIVDTAIDEDGNEIRIIY